MLDEQSPGSEGEIKPGEVSVGNWSIGAIDLDEILLYGNSNSRMTSKGKFVHEAYEQYLKVKNPNMKFTEAHKLAKEKENLTTNFKRTKDIYKRVYGEIYGIEYFEKNKRDENNQIIEIFYEKRH